MQSGRDLKNPIHIPIVPPSWIQTGFSEVEGKTTAKRPCHHVPFFIFCYHGRHQGLISQRVKIDLSNWVSILIADQDVIVTIQIAIVL